MENAPASSLIRLDGKVAIVTGGAMGIGYGIASRLAEAGAHVLIADINEASTLKAAADLSAHGWNVSAVAADVSISSDAQRIIDAAKRLGGVDILVNNAGIYPTAPIRQMDEALFDKILSVNLRSVFLLTKAAAEAMIDQGRGGSIINISSIDAIKPSSVGLAAYDASKHGIYGFTMSAAREYAPHGIRINALAPGGINTPGTGAGAPRSAQLAAEMQEFEKRIPLGRMGEPDDIGAVALFLASDLSRYMTGTQVVVDGGALLA